MSERQTTTVGSRGTVVIPADLRRRYGLEEGSTVIAEPREDGLLLLIVALVVVFVFWQRDQESQDVEIEFDTGDAATVVEPGPPLACALPEGIGLSVA